MVSTQEYKQKDDDKGPDIFPETPNNILEIRQVEA